MAVVTSWPPGLMNSPRGPFPAGGIADEPAHGIARGHRTGSDQLLGMIRSGEIVASEAWDSTGFKLNGENASINFVAPSTGALGWIDTFALPAKGKNDEAAYKWINFMLKPENSGYFTSAEKTPTASKGAAPFIDPAFQANFDRSFPQATIDNINWYPPVPANLEAMEGKVLDKVKASN